MLKKRGAALNFTFPLVQMLDRHEDLLEALADPEGLVWQVSIKYSKILMSFVIFLI